MSWGLHLVQYTPLWQKILAWNASLQNPSQNCQKSSRKRLAFSSQRFAAVCWSRHKLHEDNNYQWWILGPRVWPGNKSPDFPMEDSRSLRPKRHTKFRARFKWRWQFSSVTKASFTMSTYQMVIPLATVLCRSSLLAAWCSAVQATCVV